MTKGLARHKVLFLCCARPLIFRRVTKDLDFEFIGSTPQPDNPAASGVATASSHASWDPLLEFLKVEVEFEEQRGGCLPVRT